MLGERQSVTEKAREVTLTENLILAAENLNEIQIIIGQMYQKINGPMSTEDSCKGPWPPELGLREWAENNLGKSTIARNSLQEILRAM
jgi:hypothetical protein